MQDISPEEDIFIIFVVFYFNISEANNIPNQFLGASTKKREILKCWLNIFYMKK